MRMFGEAFLKCRIVLNDRIRNLKSMRRIMGKIICFLFMLLASAIGTDYQQGGGEEGRKADRVEGDKRRRGEGGEEKRRGVLLSLIISMIHWLQTQSNYITITFAHWKREKILKRLLNRFERKNNNCLYRYGFF